MKSRWLTFSQLMIRIIPVLVLSVSLLRVVFNGNGSPEVTLTTLLALHIVFLDEAKSFIVFFLLAIYSVGFGFPWLAALSPYPLMQSLSGLALVCWGFYSFSRMFLKQLKTT